VFAAKARNFFKIMTSVSVSVSVYLFAIRGSRERREKKVLLQRMECIFYILFGI